MKIGIVTFINTINYGASLQAYALQEALKKFGADAEVIQYNNIRIENKEKNKKSFSTKGLVKALLMGKGIKKRCLLLKNMKKNLFIPE